jgi:RNA polymerase sigma-70 factor (ECF subfamily)
MNFDAEFVTRLQQRDPDTCTFLISSMTPLLEARLRYKLRDHGMIEDIRNETFYRVFRLVDRGRIRKPEQLGSFVRGVCDRVVHESCRKAHSVEPLPGAGFEPSDRQPHPDEVLVEKERRALVWREVMKLPEEDRRLIVEMHSEECDRRRMARERGISRTGLNVRLCRAIKRLRKQVLLEESSVQPARRRCRRAAPHTAKPGGKNGKAHRKSRLPNGWATMAA